MLQPVDRFLNTIAMYRLVLWGLWFLAAVSIVLAFTGVLTLGPWSLLSSLAIIVVSCWLSNALFARLWKVPANVESWSITAFILFFLFSPVADIQSGLILACAGLIAMGSKYVLAIRGKHLFNPAAFAAVVLGFTGSFGWWVGTRWMLSFVLIVGFLIVRKIKRFPMVLACIAASLIVAEMLGMKNGMAPSEMFMQHFVSWPIIFFATVMVTEPLTTPPRRWQQMLYGALIGAVSSWPLHVGSVWSTPEMVLVIANLFSYAVSLRRRLILKLVEKKKIARDTYEYSFDPGEPLSFLPGQYLEWTLPHEHADNRGNRRYFTIASSPTEKHIKLGVKIGESISTYKQRLRDMQIGDTLLAGQLSGDFVLPKDPSQKLAFIAGGIGITPFRSMIQYLIDTKQKRDVVLFYSGRTREDLAYIDLFLEAEEAIGLRLIPVLTDKTDSSAVSVIDEALIRQKVPDCETRRFYLSGPTGMVDAYKDLLSRVGVPRTHIVTDYFPGFA